MFVLLFSKDARRAAVRAVCTPAAKLGQALRRGIPGGRVERTTPAPSAPSPASARDGVTSFPIVVASKATPPPSVASKTTPVVAIPRLPPSIFLANRGRLTAAQMHDIKLLDTLLRHADALEDRFCPEQAAEVVREAMHATATVRALSCCPYGQQALLEYPKLLLLLPALSVAIDALQSQIRRHSQHTSRSRRDRETSVTQVPSIKTSTAGCDTLRRVQSDASTSSGLTNGDITPLSALGSVLPGPFAAGRPALQDKPMSRLGCQDPCLNPFAGEFKIKPAGL